MSVVVRTFEMMLGGILGFVHRIVLHRLGAMLLVFTLLAILMATQLDKTADDDLRLLRAPQVVAAIKLMDWSGRTDPATADAINSERAGALLQRSITGPGYAFVLYAAALVSPGVNAALHCRFLKKGCAAANLLTLKRMQVLISLLALLSVFVCAAVLSRSFEVGLLAAIAAYIGGSFGEFAAFLQPQVWSPALLAGMSALTALAFVRGYLILFLPAGFLFAMAALFWPFVAIATLPIVPVLFVAIARHRGSLAAGSLGALLFVAGVGSVVVGVAGLEPEFFFVDAMMRQLAHDFAHRVPFGSADALTAVVGLVHPIPFVGGLVDFLAPDDLTRRFEGYVPGSYIHTAVTKVYPAIASQTSDGAGQLAVLWDSYVVSQPFAFLIATSVILANALWTGSGIVGLAAIFHVGTASRMLRAAERWTHIGVLAPVLIILIGAVLLTAAHTPVSRLMILIWSYVVALVCVRSLAKPSTE